MPPPTPRYTKREHFLKGDDIYQQIRPQVEPGNHGKFVAIDIDSGAYEVADAPVTAADRLLARVGDPLIWCVRIGGDGLYRWSPLGPREERLFPPRQSRYSGEEVFQRGMAIYQQLLPLVEAANHGRIVAIDIETGAYELGNDEIVACDRLFSRVPDAQILCVRVGHPAVHRLPYRVMWSQATRSSARGCCTSTS